MFSELTDLLDASPQDADVDGFSKSIVDENVLGKQTIAGRRLTYQRLRELYGLDPGIPLFRVLRRAWAVDEHGRPLIAILCALARDPLLRATAPTVLALPVGAELVRSILLDALRTAVGDRLSEPVLDKVARNAGSSWCQSGHLVGRVRKIRRRVAPTPGAVAVALWLGTLEGLAGRALLESTWARVLDRTADELLAFALEAKQMGLIHARVGGGVVELDASRLDPARS
jgi:alkylhydroperoxidase family enzyme